VDVFSSQIKSERFVELNDFGRTRTQGVDPHSLNAEPENFFSSRIFQILLKSLRFRRIWAVSDRSDFDVFEGFDCDT